MTPADEALRRLAEGAMPGPWKKDISWHITGPENDWNSSPPRQHDAHIVCQVFGPSKYGIANQEFIIAAREWMIPLLDRLAAAEADAKEWEARAELAARLVTDGPYAKEAARLMDLRLRESGLQERASLAEARLARCVEALRAAEVELLHVGQGEPGYGYFCGGDPRDFCPDPECSTEAERAAHAADCAAWDRGERTHSVEHGHSPIGDAETGIIGHVHHSGYGLGSYQLPDERVMAVHAKVRAALAECDGEKT